MLYAADDFETACREVADPDQMTGKEVTGAKFRTVIPLNLLDLTAIQHPRSFFSNLDRRSRHAIEFLEEFAAELSRLIQRDERQHIEYVPTQVFTEYVRFEMRTPAGEPLHRIKYRSSQTGRACYVMFAEQADCLPGPASRSSPQLVQFVDGSLQTQVFRLKCKLFGKLLWVQKAIVAIRRACRWKVKLRKT